MVYHTFRFTTTRFAAVPADDAINDSLGRDLVAWLRTGLIAAGYTVDPVISEDYGYGAWLRVQGAQYWLFAGNEEDDPTGTRWMVGVTRDPGCLWWGLLRTRPDPARDRQVVDAVRALLAADPAIHDLTTEQSRTGRAAVD